MIISEIIILIIYKNYNLYNLRDYNFCNFQRKLIFVNFQEL